MKPEWLEKEKLEMKSESGVLAAAATSCRTLSATPGFYSREVCAKPDLYFKRITPATVWRKRASVAIGYYCRTQEGMMAWTMVGAAEMMGI